MAITQDASATSSIDIATELTFALTVASGATKLIVQAICVIPTQQPELSKVTYAGVNLTRAVKADNTTLGSSAEIWYLDNPATGANNVIVTTVSGDAYLRATATSLFGAASGVPEDTDFLSDQGPGTTVLLTLTGTVGAWIFDAISSVTNAVTPADDQTQNMDYDVGTTRGSYSPDVVNTSTSTSWFYTLDVTGICAVRIAPLLGGIIMSGDGLYWNVQKQ